MNQQTKKLNQLNNILDRQINTENREAFTDIICYLRGADISEYHQEIIRQDLLDMVLSAQKRGENIRAVIGEDYQAFCDEIIANLPRRNRKEKVVEFLDIICWCLSVLGTINILMADETIAMIHNFATGRGINYEISISVGNVISAVFIIAIALTIVNSIAKKAFQIGKKEKISTMKIFFLCIAIGGILLLISWIGKATLFTVNIFTACIFTFALYIAHRILAKVQS